MRVRARLDGLRLGGSFRDRIERVRRAVREHADREARFAWGGRVKSKGRATASLARSQIADEPPQTTQR